MSSVLDQILPSFWGVWSRLINHEMTFGFRSEIFSKLFKHVPMQLIKWKKAQMAAAADFTAFELVGLTIVRIGIGAPEKPMVYSCIKSWHVYTYFAAAAAPYHLALYSSLLYPSITRLLSRGRRKLWHPLLASRFGPEYSLPWLPR
jgi:hypothetical protein